MINRFINTLTKYDMISSGDRVLLAVSGGADSVVMLKLFTEIKERFSLNLVVAHIEHGIRGADSVADAEFVKELCRKLDLDFHMLSINAVSEAKACGESVEEYSRRRRYEFFDTIDCDKIATAHNADDNAETLIFRLCRGTGLKGACSIPHKRGKIIRPMLDFSSAEIREYAQSKGIEYRIDSTNSSNDYSRNYIRNSVIPALQKVNSSCVSRLNSFIEDINQDNNFIENFANDCYTACLCNDRLSVDLLKKYDISIIKRIILIYFNNCSVSLDRLHLDEITKLIDKTGRYQIKGDSLAVSSGGYLYFYDRSKASKKAEIISQILNVFEFDKNSVDFYCDYDKIKGGVYFRSRLSGDKITPAGRNCTKTLKKLFNELKIPETERSSVTVACDDSGVIGVVGFCVDERVKLDENTKTVLSVKIPMEDLLDE